MPKFGSAIDAQQIPIKGLVPESSGTAPTGPAVGRLWTDTANDVVKWWDGEEWVPLDGSVIADGVITDAHIASGAAIALSKLASDPLDRANHTGTQTAATISDFDTAVRASRLDQMAAPSAALDLNGQRVTNAGAAVGSSDLVTLQQLNDARSGLAGVKDPVRVAMESNVTLSGPGATLDGVTMQTGDRVLLSAQTTGTQNGIYVWTGAASALTRASDADAVGEIQDGTLVAVSDGTRAGAQFIQTATPSGAPGSWTQSWVVYNTSGTSYNAGAGLVLSGNTFNVVAADSSLTVAADSITVGNVPVSKGGTGGTTAATARANLAAVTQYEANAPALSAGVASNISHNLGTTDVQVYVREITGGARVFLDETIVDSNTVSLKADIAYGSGTLRVTVQGKA